MIALHEITSSEARNRFRDIVDDAQHGSGSLIIRNGKPVAALLPAVEAQLLPVVHAVLRELGESLMMSDDPELVAAVKVGMEQIAQGQAVTYKV